jgi:hypothetical protein
MPRSSLFAALAAIALWGVLAALSLQLRGWPPFLLAGAALLVGSRCSIHRLGAWRVPGRARAIGALAYLAPLASTLVLVAAGEGTLGPPTLVAMALIVGGAVLGGR